MESIRPTESLQRFGYFRLANKSATPGKNKQKLLFLSGVWDGDLTRTETSTLGKQIVYWAWFDEPQFDADGDGPYRGGEMWKSALSLITDRPN